MLRLKFAPTVWLAFIVTVHVGPGLVQSPLQPMKVEPPSAPADRVTTVLVAYGWEQVLPHVIPGLSLVTLPVPLPGFCTREHEAVQDGDVRRERVVLRLRVVGDEARTD